MRMASVRSMGWDTRKLSHVYYACVWLGNLSLLLSFFPFFPPSVYYYYYYPHPPCLPLLYLLASSATTIILPVQLPSFSLPCPFLWRCCVHSSAYAAPFNQTIETRDATIDCGCQWTSQQEIFTLSFNWSAYCLSDPPQQLTDEVYEYIFSLEYSTLFMCFAHANTETCP